MKRDITYKIFTDPNYKLPIVEACKYVDLQGNLRHYDLYATYDLSGSNEKIAGLSFEQRDALQNKLVMINEILFNDYNITCRMRIKNFKDENTFIVVSDNKCKVQLETFVSTIYPGLKIKVANGKYEIIFEDEFGNIIKKDEVNFIEGTENLIERSDIDYDSLKKATELYTAATSNYVGNEDNVVAVDFTKKSPKK